ncbi:MAG: tetratricopeptide repeat protein, partial [Candidatus Sulfotelmatobacter sp.]
MRFVPVLLLILGASCFAQTAETYRQQAVVDSRQKSWDQAITNYRKALELEPNDALTHYNLALALKYKGDDHQAVEEFEAALRLKPKWGDAHYGLGATWYDLDDQPAALKELRIAVGLAPANAAAHQMLARIYLEQKDPSDAKTELQQALASKPSAELHSELGLTEGQLGDLPGAAAEFRRALQLDPQLAPAHLLLGETLRRQGDHAGALAQFRKAVAIDPNEPRAQLNLGKELKASGDLAGAIAAFQRAIELKPDFEDAHYNLGLALRAQGKTGAAQKEMKEISALDEFRARLAEAKLLILQGVQALEEQRLDDALASFQKATEKSPELPTGYYYLGLTWERKNDAVQALAA